VNEGTVGRPIVPREHGAWAVLYGAFLAGVGIAGRVGVPVLLLLGAVTLLAFANGPLVLILRSAGSRASERRRATLWFFGYTAGAVVCGVPLLAVYHMTFLAPFAMAAACFLILRAFLLRGGDDRSLPGELIGTAGLALVGPTAHAVAVNGAQPIGALLWLLLTLYFASGVYYVRMRIRVMMARRKNIPTVSSRARWSCVAYHVLLLVLIPALAAGGVVPWAVFLAFAPALWRAAAGLRRQDATLDLRRLGWSEVGLTAVFVLILIVSL
jgi:hypothetical protein